MTDANFWPQIMARCTQDWSDLAHQPGIPRLLSGFDPKTMSFTDAIMKEFKNNSSLLEQGSDSSSGSESAPSEDNM